MVDSIPPGSPEERRPPAADRARRSDAESTFGMPARDETGEGTRLGPYRVFERIGEGGMGEVFAAEQTEPFRRRVAIKLIKLGMDTGAIVQRFEAERQALAMMDHSNIARAYDAGVSPSGRPYFVMELVRGVPITRYCDENRLTIRERLELFLPVCYAVQHAHQKGIIHRDLKPSNVLVTLVDGRPVPKVIDFGIAKAVGYRLTDQTIHTVQGQLIGTPEYMSPEQAASEIDVDTRSDIYSLGVILYEILTGTLLFDSAAVRTPTPGAAQRAIREREPERPSRRLATLAAGRAARGANTPPRPPSEGTALEQIARCRGTDPGTLRRQIHGDLDWIVMRCLETNRARRYDTANELALDLVRHMDNRAVTAGPPRASYRLAKFARRNRTLLAAVSAVLLALVAGLGFATYGLVTARKERDAARSSEARAAAVNAFLQDMLASVDPSRALGREVTMRGALEEAARKVDAGGLRAQPEVEAAVRTTIGKTYQALGDFASAERHLRVALDMTRARFGPTDPRVAEGLTGLSSVLYDEDQTAAAESLARASLEIPQKPGTDGDLVMRNNLNLLAMIANGAGRLSEADSLYRIILRNEQASLDPNDPMIATTLSNLGGLVADMGRLSEAESLMRKTLAIDSVAYGSEHPEVATDLGKLASVLRGEGDLEGAEALYRESLAMRMRLLGSAHPSLALTLSNLGQLLAERDKFPEAESFMRKALAIDSVAYGSEHPEVATDLGRLGRILQDSGHLDGAEKVYRQACVMWLRLRGSDDPDLAYADRNLARTLVKKGAATEALSLFKTAAAIDRKVYGPGTDLAGQLEHIADLLHEAGQDVEAEENFREALAMRQEASGVDAPDVLVSMARLGDFLTETRRPGEGEALLRHVLERRRATLPRGAWLTYSAESLVGRSLAAQGRYAEAESLLIDGYEGMMRDPETVPERRAGGARTLLELYKAWGKDAQAKVWAKKLSQTP